MNASSGRRLYYRCRTFLFCSHSASDVSDLPVETSTKMEHGGNRSRFTLTVRLAW
jgi:hypothetical protein